MRCGAVRARGLPCRSGTPFPRCLGTAGRAASGPGVEAARVRRRPGVSGNGRSVFRSAVKMSAPTMEERKACWGARDEFWQCLDRHGDDASQCEKLRLSFESRCPQQWVSSSRRGLPQPLLGARRAPSGLSGSQHRQGTALAFFTAATAASRTAERARPYAFSEISLHPRQV